MLAELLKKLSLTLCPHEAELGNALFEKDERRYAHHFETAHDFEVVVDVDLGNPEAALVLLGDLVEHWLYELARATPLRPKVDQDGLGSSPDLFVERGISDCGHQLGHVPTSPFVRRAIFHLCSPFKFCVQPRIRSAWSHSTRRTETWQSQASEPGLTESPRQSRAFVALQPAFRINRSHATCTGGGDGLAVPVVHQVTGCEHPVDTGRRRPVTGEDITLLIDLELTSQDVAARDMTDRNKQAGDGQLPFLTRPDVLELDAFELVGPDQPGSRRCARQSGPWGSQERAPA